MDIAESNYSGDFKSASSTTSFESKELFQELLDRLKECHDTTVQGMKIRTIVQLALDLFYTSNNNSNNSIIEKTIYLHILLIFVVFTLYLVWSIFLFRTAVKGKQTEEGALFVSSLKSNSTFYVNNGKKEYNGKKIHFILNVFIACFKKCEWAVASMDPIIHSALLQMYCTSIYILYTRFQFFHEEHCL